MIARLKNTNAVKDTEAGIELTLWPKLILIAHQHIMRAGLVETCCPLQLTRMGRF
jgi:hypothetical protein